MASSPLEQWSEATVARYLRLYRGGRVPPSALAQLGPLVNGRELLAQLDNARAHDLLKEAVREAKRDPVLAWAACDPYDEADELELGLSASSSKSSGGGGPLRDPLLMDGRLAPKTARRQTGEDDGDEPDGAFPPLLERPSLGVMLFVAFVVLGMVLCTTVFASELADAAGMSSRAEFIKRFLQYASIPIGTTIFTYAHVWFALWCTFYPLEFIGCWQIPGTNVGFPLGWRGIIPFKGEEMARMAVRMIKQHLLTVDEVFTRLEPARMGEILQPALVRKLEKIIDIVANEEMPGVWRNLPSGVKQEIARRAGQDSPKAVCDMIVSMRPEIESLLDLEHLVVDVLVNDLRLCVDVFVVCGHKELAFIRNAGAVMGGTLGVCQMITLFFYNPVWFLPLVGLLAGALTNYLALLLIFWPVYPIDLCGGRLRLHGRFLRRQREVSKAYGKLVHRHVLKVRNIVNELLNGERKQRVREIVRESVWRTVDQSLAPMAPFLSLVPGSQITVNRVKDRVCTLIHDGMFDLMMEAEDYMDQQFDLEYTLESRMARLEYPKFESLLHPIFQAEEWKLVLVGAVVGLLFGIAQVLLVGTA